MIRVNTPILGQHWRPRSSEAPWHRLAVETVGSDDGRRAVDSTRAPTAEDSAAAVWPGVRRRTDPDRRLRAPWFEDRAPACTALVYVDDATSRLMVVRFAGTESTFAYFEATRQYLDRYGKPLAFYSDKASIFRVNQKRRLTGQAIRSSGGRFSSLILMGFVPIPPAAKGRVERAHLTLQDRLVKELRLEGISTIEAANAFMPRFINDYNRRFAKEPLNSHDAHRPVRDDEDLDSHFQWREPRKVTSRLTLHYERKLYMLADTAVNRGSSASTSSSSVPGWPHRDPGGRGITPLLHLRPSWP